MLTPKIVQKRRYPHKISYEGATKGHKEIVWGQFGLQAEKGAWISNKQIEAVRRVLSRHVKNFGKVRINIYPHLAKTKHALETRMGSGKGSVHEWVAVVKKGTIMFEIKLDDFNKYKEEAYKGLKQAIYKLPIPCKVVDKIW